MYTEDNVYNRFVSLNPQYVNFDVNFRSVRNTNVVSLFDCLVYHNFTLCVYNFYTVRNILYKVLLPNCFLLYYIVS